MSTQHTISVSNLTYSHKPGSPPSLEDINIRLPQGSRTIICGANGGQKSSFIGAPLLIMIFKAGKSTLLQILAGKRLITAPGAEVRIKDRDVFRDSPPGVTFLGTEWFVFSARSDSYYYFSQMFQGDESGRSWGYKGFNLLGLSRRLQA